MYRKISEKTGGKEHREELLKKRDPREKQNRKGADRKMKVTDSILYAGVNDHQVDLFEGQYLVPRGMSYNSYVIVDEKIAVMDTVDAAFGQEWLGNVEAALQGRRPDYLVIQHMEPDHSGSIPLFLEKYPEAEIVATPATSMWHLSHKAHGIACSHPLVSARRES